MSSKHVRDSSEEHVLEVIDVYPDNFKWLIPLWFKGVVNPYDTTSAYGLVTYDSSSSYLFY